MDMEMGPQSSSEPSGGQRLTKEDQQDRLLHFQRMREEQDGSPEDNMPIADGSQGYSSMPNQDGTSSGCEEQVSQNSVSSQTCANRSTAREPSDSSQRPSGESTNQTQDPGSENFNLTDSHSSFVLSAPQVSSTPRGSSEMGSATEGCGSCDPKPLSSTVSDVDSQTTLSLKGLSVEEDQAANLNVGTSKQLEGNEPQSNYDDRRFRPPSEYPMESKSQQLHGPLVSRENFSSVDEEDSDEEEEFHDVLILCDSVDEEHLKKFKEICEKNGWTTITKDEFPPGECHFFQIQEEVEHCTLVVPLLTHHSLNHEQSKMEQHTALFSSLSEKCGQKFVPVACEQGLRLPNFMQAINPGNLYSPHLEKQLKRAMKREKKKMKMKMGCKNLPMNPLGGSTGNSKGSAQAARGESPTQVFRGLQDNLSPGPNAQRFVTDVRFRELCLVLDLSDPLGTPHWQRLADHLGLTSQEINWQNQQRRCAPNVLEFYFHLHRRESVEKVLCNLMEICEMKLGHIQARNILAQEIEDRRSVFKNGTKSNHNGSKDSR